MSSIGDFFWVISDFEWFFGSIISWLLIWDPVPYSESVSIVHLICFIIFVPDVRMKLWRLPLRRLVCDNNFWNFGWLKKNFWNFGWLKKKLLKLHPCNTESSECSWILTQEILKLCNTEAFFKFADARNTWWHWSYTILKQLTTQRNFSDLNIKQHNRIVYGELLQNCKVFQLSF